MADHYDPAYRAAGPGIRRRRSAIVDAGALTEADLDQGRRADRRRGSPPGTSRPGCPSDPGPCGSLRRGLAAPEPLGARA